MKILFIVPSSQWLDSAGVRIRYKRLQPFFIDNGSLSRIIPLQDISESEISDADVVTAATAAAV